MWKFGLCCSILYGFIVYFGARITPFPPLYLLQFYLISQLLLFSFCLLEKLGYKAFSDLGFAVVGLFFMMNPAETYSILRVSRGLWMKEAPLEVMVAYSWFFGGLMMLFGVSGYIQEWRKM